MQNNPENFNIDIIGIRENEATEKNFLEILNMHDIVHIHWVHPYILSEEETKSFCKTLGIIKKKKNALIIWTIHNTVSHECQNRDQEIARRKSIANHCDRFIVHSRHAACEIKELYDIKEENIYIIPHGKYEINQQKINNLIGEKTHHTKSMRLTILGELRAYKNVEWAAKFIDKINKEMILENKIELRIAGRSISHEQSEFLHRIAASNKYISLNLKRLSEEELLYEFCCSDFIFIPYKKILTSGICINSISHGKPFIAPRFPSLLELEKYNSSFLYDSEEELQRELIKFSDYHHRGILTHIFDYKSIIENSAELEWEYIFKNLENNPFAPI